MGVNNNLCGGEQLMEGFIVILSIASMVLIGWGLSKEERVQRWTADLRDRENRKRIEERLARFC